MEIYFDNSATTKIDDSVLDCMSKFSEDFYANPSAMHRAGFIVENKVKEATTNFAKIINAGDNEIIWTSGGSESNNLAIRGFVEAHKKDGNKIITTKIEHPSVLKVMNKLEEDGFNVIYLDVDSDGQIDIDDLISKIDNETILVSIMAVNNEIGAYQNIDLIGNAIKEKNPRCAFHIDFVQAFAKYKIDVKKSSVDFLSISAHKFHGPKGIGVLYKNSKMRIVPLILGGGQQNALRAGTLNTPSIIGTSFAANLAYDNFEKNREQLLLLRDYLIDKLEALSKKYDIIKVHTKKSNLFAPHIVSISFMGIRAEVMLHALEDKGIYVSAGSACSSHDKKISNTLLSIGLKPEIAESTIRVSFGKYNSIDEVDEFIEALNQLIPILNIKKR